MTTIHKNGQPRRFWRLLTEWEQHALRDVAVQRHFPKGECICEEGTEAMFAFVIESGAVKISRQRYGYEEVVAIRGADDFVGEGILSDDRRNATVTALCPVRVLFLGFRELDVLLRGFHGIDLAVRRFMRDRHEESDRRMLDPLTTSSNQRLARILLELADDFGRALPDMSYAVDVDLSRKELGQLAGCSARTVERSLSNWRSRGIVGSDGDVVIVIDDSELRRIAGLAHS